MRRFLEKRDSAFLRLSLFLLLGVISGTIFCGKMSGEMQTEFLSLGTELFSRAALRRAGGLELFAAAALRRFLELGFLFLLMLTPAAGVLVPMAAGYFGFSAAVFICGLTMAGGFRGIVRYLAMILPQACFYVPAAYLAAVWMPENQKKLKPGAAAVLGALTLLGAAAEGFLNPWIAGAVW